MRTLLVAALVVVVAAGPVGGVRLVTRGSSTPARDDAAPRGPKIRQVVRRRPTRPPVLKLPAVLPRRTVKLPILMYHRIDALDPSLPAITHRLTVAPADFAAQMRWLKRDGYHAVTQRKVFAALEHGARLPSKPVMLTFDDGYRDVYRNAFPVLARLHMPATAYVITERVGAPDPTWLTWHELRIMERGGMEIGSHTVTHADLTTLNDYRLSSQLGVSRRTLQERLGHPVKWLAYPAGAHDDRVVRFARRLGYVLAVTTIPGSAQAAAHPLELHRYEVLDTTGVGGVAAMVRAG